VSGERGDCAVQIGCGGEGLGISCFGEGSGVEGRENCLDTKLRVQVWMVLVSVASGGRRHAHSSYPRVIPGKGGRERNKEGDRERERERERKRGKERERRERKREKERKRERER